MGLQHNDLKNMVDHIFEIDSFKSKMGEDMNIVTLSFSTKTDETAKDLVNFLEKGYSFILDADATAGEQKDGTYKVFVEMEREDSVPEQIVEIIDGVSKLAGEDNFKFRYYKNFRSMEATLENLKGTVPVDPDNYGLQIKEVAMESYKNFFNRSYVDSIEMSENILAIKKVYADPLYFNFIDIGNKDEILNSINETITVDDNGFAEIIFLSKYIGDYNITKFGNKLTFENDNKVLVLTRINT
jgi:hypothetical protein|tara:strand:- start:207 stop:932 length:726 start_codon:yes stop_codon:yes gene_type:complete